MGQAAKRAPWHCPGRCRAQLTARRPATSQSGLALPMSGLCLAGMNPLRPTGYAGDVLVVAGSGYGRHLDDDPACC
jgi:hypothetical protein